MKEKAASILDKKLEETEREIAKLTEIWKAELEKERLSLYNKIFGN